MLAATSLSEVAVSSDDRTWVGGTKDGSGFLGGSSDVWIGRADFPGDRIVDEFRAGSEGTDRLYAMERGANGEIYVAFTVGGRKVSFGGLDYDLDTAPVTAASAPHAFLGMIRSDGSPGWLTPLGFSQTPGGSLFPQGLSVDEGGTAYVAVQGSGDWVLEGVLVPALGSGQVTVSGRGRMVDFTPTPFLDQARCGAVPDAENRLVLGVEAGHSGFASLESLAVKQSSQFVCWLDPNQPGNTVDALSALVTSSGGQVHNELDFAAYGTVGVSAWLTPDQIRALDNTGVLKVVADPLIIEPDAGFGEVGDPGWGLARLFDPYFVEADGPSASYFYPAALATGDADPDAPKTVRVYVIDKGLEAVEPFVFQNLPGQGGLPIVFDGANGVDVEALVAPTNDGVFVPDTISDHPRQVVSLLAAANVGTAQGAAMEIIPGDMYSGASPATGNSVTYASYVSHCIYNALTDAFARDLVEPLPTLIVIASSGMDPMDQVGIGGALDQALLQGVTVILSAGNNPEPAQAGDFVPAMHGDKDGVITVGATAFDDDPPPDPTLAELNPLYAFGNVDNSRQVVSLYAPGSLVETGYGSSSGTSFSCALVAGLAANYLTAHPDATPAQVEEALVRMSVHDPVRDIRLARSACAYEAWLYRNGLGEVASEPVPDYDTDSDGDGDPDLWEFIGSSDPDDPDSRARVPVSFDLNGTSGLIGASLPFPVVSASDQLHDGCWTIPVTLELGDDLENWQVVPPDEIDLGPVVDGLQELRFGIDLEPYSDDRCFLRFVFGPPVSP